jgi:ferric-dicitrate binding protein FerR (iron transport regulator)
MEKETFYQLIDRYQSGTATPEEQVLLESYYQELTQGRTELEGEEELRLRTVVLDKILARTTKQPVQIYKKVWIRYAAAAVLLFAIATTYFIINSNNKSTAPVIAYKGDVAAPATNKATLTLANGKQIILDSVGKGALTASASKTADGAIIYDNKTGAIEFNTLSNPKGSKPVQLTLADGSVVWLNAASSITFPTAFRGTTRDVSMTGEAYFEVVHNTQQPFKVKAGNQVIEDLGTVFNVNAYTDEPAIKTTLIQGSVKINNAVLKPGQQYVNGNIEAADIDQALAWKNGLFSFKDADVRTVMRQLGRWYDVEVVFSAGVPDARFEGDIDRNLNLAAVLRGLKQTRVHFRIEEDKRIVILP